MRITQPANATVCGCYAYPLGQLIEIVRQLTKRIAFQGIIVDAKGQHRSLSDLSISLSLCFSKRQIVKS